MLLLWTIAVLGAQFFLWHSPLILDASWKPRGQGNPLLQILLLLAVSVGLPYLILASTAPLLQSWWRRLYPQHSPYRLYAVSNLGSFLGLVSYPFLVEPFLDAARAGAGLSAATPRLPRAARIADEAAARRARRSLGTREDSGPRERDTSRGPSF